MKRLISLVMAALMAVSLAACGGSSASTGTATENPNATKPAVEIAKASNVNQGSTAESVGTTTTAEEKVIDETKKKELIVCAPTEGKCFVAWDPDTNMSSACIPFALQVYETPFKMNPDGGLEPLLAKEYRWSDDGCHLSMTFRDDVFFSNGDPLTLEDIAWSIDMTARSSIGRTLYTSYDSTEITGDNEVTIHLTDPNPSLVVTMSSRLSCIYDKKYYDEVDLKGYIDNPIGSGPYLLKEKVLASHQTYVVNENYWNKAEEGLPFYEKVTIKYLADNNTQMLALENGEVDVLLQASISPFLRLDPDSPITFDTRESSTILDMKFNQVWGITKNEEFRRFLQYAINRDEINIGVYEGMASPANTYCPPMCTGVPDAGTYTPVPDCDPEKAKQMLQDMGYNNEEFIIACMTGTKAEQAAIIIQGQLLNLGVNCTVKAVDQASFNALTKLTEGWHARMRNNPIPSMDMDTMRTNLSYDHKVASNGTLDVVRSEELEELFKASTKTADNEKRKAIFADVTTYCNEHAYFLPLIFEFTVVGYNKNVKGVHAYPLDSLIYYKELY